MSTINTDNYTLGGINLFFEASVANASLLATSTDTNHDLGLGGQFRSSARNLGNIVTAEFGNETTYIEHYISIQGLRRRDKTSAQLVNISIPFTFDEINEQNLKYFFLASDLTTNAAWIAPGQVPLVEGSAQMQFETDTGNDFTYFIPKCTIKPDGNMAMNEEDWWTGPMVLDVLYWNGPAGAADHWASKAYGFINASNIDS